MTNKAIKTMTSLPVKDLLRLRMKDLDIKNVDFARALDYAKPNVVAMMKSGSMQLPANKVRDAARILQLDPVFLLGKVVAESDPELWDVISTLLGRQLVTANEMAVIDHLRHELDGHDVDLTKEASFVSATASRLEAIVKRENALVMAALHRSDKGKDKGKHKVPATLPWV